MYPVSFPCGLLHDNLDLFKIKFDPIFLDTLKKYLSVFQNQLLITYVSSQPIREAVIKRICKQPTGGDVALCS